jgi:hypothetical protein
MNLLSRTDRNLLDRDRDGTRALPAPRSSDIGAMRLPPRLRPGPVLACGGSPRMTRPRAPRTPRSHRSRVHGAPGAGRRRQRRADRELRDPAAARLPHDRVADPRRPRRDRPRRGAGAAGPSRRRLAGQRADAGRGHAQRARPISTIEVGGRGGGDRAAVPVADTLDRRRHAAGVGAPARDLAGRQRRVRAIVPQAAITGTPLDAWGGVCDYARWDTDAFVAGSASRDVWLFDRVTAMYRGYAITGALEPLRSSVPRGRHLPGRRHRRPARDADRRAGRGRRSQVPLQPGPRLALPHHRRRPLPRGRRERRGARPRLVDRPGLRRRRRLLDRAPRRLRLLAYEYAARVSDDRARAVRRLGRAPR